MKITKTKGYSLLEGIIVLAIVVITATIAMFAASRYTNNSNLRTAARQLESDISILKEQAIKMGSSYTISFNRTSNTYTINGPTVLTKSMASFGNGIYIFSLPGGGSTYTLNFLARGVFSGTVGTITLKNNRGSWANIAFNITGKIYVTFGMQ